MAPLAKPVTVTGTGTQTVDLGEAPTGTTNIEIELACLTAGTFQFSDGAAIECAAGDIGTRSATGSYRRSASGTTRTTTITAKPGDRWRATFTYSKVTIKPWGVNTRGQTYGVTNENGTPGLIATVATNDKDGYVLSKELDVTPPTSLSQAAPTLPHLEPSPYTHSRIHMRRRHSDRRVRHSRQIAAAQPHKTNPE
ncbi:MAG: hypothetical protein ABI382_05215 [Nakamurella sp.]